MTSLGMSSGGLGNFKSYFLDKSPEKSSLYFKSFVQWTVNVRFNSQNTSTLKK